MLMTVDFRRALLRALFVPAVVAVVVVSVVCLSLLVWMFAPLG